MIRRSHIVCVTKILQGIRWEIRIRALEQPNGIEEEPVQGEGFIDFFKRMDENPPIKGGIMGDHDHNLVLLRSQTSEELIHQMVEAIEEGVSLEHAL